MVKEKKFLFGFFSPLLLGWSFVLTLYEHNITELPLKHLTYPLFAILLLVSAFLLFFRFLFRENLKTILFASVFTLMFFSYGSVALLFSNLPYSFLFFPLWILIIFWLFFFLKKTNKNLDGFYHFLVVTSLISFLLPAGKIANYEINERIRTPIKSKTIVPAVNKKSLKSTPPDIYYIITDSYSAPSVSEKLFHFDDSAFSAFLESKGFYVADLATSNYPKTFLSLGSSFNMEYLNYLSVYKHSSDQTIITPFIQNGNAVRFLRKLGYRFYQMGSWWEITHYNSFADDNFLMEKKGLQNIGVFNSLLIESTMLNPILANLFPKVIIGDSEDEKRARIIYQFEQFPKLVKLLGPKFVFIHILSPHEPYVFDENCGFVNQIQILNKSDEENYANQVLCLNKKLEKAIDTIIAKSKQPPIILLQSDEGAPFLKRRVEPEDSWGKANNNLLREKFPILSAYYLPGVDNSILYSSITPVNSFRAVFNLYFGTNLPLLPDRNYIFQDLNNLYDFKEVTRLIK